MILMEKILVKNLLNMHGLINDFVTGFCKNVPFFCRYIVQFFVEDTPTNRIDYNKLLNDFPFTPSGTSSRNVNHWIQFYTTKQFTQFDHGEEMNLIIYGQKTPPVYDINLFKNYTVKSLMTVSNADPFSKEEDCQHLFEHINKDVYQVMRLDNYNHLDYLWSSDAAKDIYLDVVKFLR
jgi:lysosomal acid lipase/cholesteryl ester hydrolase